MERKFVFVIMTIVSIYALNNVVQAQSGFYYSSVPHYNQDWHTGNGDCLPNSAAQVLGFHDQQDHALPTPWPKMIPKGCSSFQNNPNGYNLTMNALKDAMDWWNNRGTVPTTGWLNDNVGTQVKKAAAKLDAAASSWWVDDDTYSSWSNMKNQINNYGPMMFIVFSGSNLPYYYGTLSNPSDGTQDGLIGSSNVGHSMCMLGYYDGTKINTNTKWVIVDMGWSGTSPAWMNYDYTGIDLYTVEIRTTGTPNSTDPLDKATNITATDGSYNDKVQLTWNSVSGAAEYEIWRNTTNNSSTASKISSVSSSTTYNDTGTNTGTTYYYWINAKYSCSGSSGSSGFSIAEAGFRAAPLNPPRSLIATAGNSQVSLTWQAPSSGTPTSYKVYRNTSENGTYTSLGTVNSLRANATNLTNETTYWFYVTAVYSSGESNASNKVSIRPTAGPPAVPVAKAATSVTQSGFTANWNTSTGATGYYLDVSTSSSFSSFVSGYNNKNVGNVVTSPVSGLSANTTYYYRVRAFNTGGTSGNSGSITVKTSSLKSSEIVLNSTQHNTDEINIYPNPFSTNLNISYLQKEESFTKLEILDLNGSIVKSIFHEKQSPGHYNFSWDATNDNSNAKVSNGIYIIRLINGNDIKTRKVIFNE
jgi:hypothetical protein